MVNRRALERGITLAEVIMVVAIGITLFAMAVPAAQNNDIAGSVVRIIVSDAVRARSHARRSWETTTLQIDTVSERWRTLKQDGSPLVNQTSDAEGWHQAPAGVDLRPAGDAQTDFSFLPNGRAAESASFQVVVGNQVWNVQLDALCARISASSADIANPEDD